MSVEWKWCKGFHKSEFYLLFYSLSCFISFFIFIFAFFPFFSCFFLVFISFATISSPSPSHALLADRLSFSIAVRSCRPFFPFNSFAVFISSFPFPYCNLMEMEREREKYFEQSGINGVSQWIKKQQIKTIFELFSQIHLFHCTVYFTFKCVYERVWHRVCVCVYLFVVVFILSKYVYTNLFSI